MSTYNFSVLKGDTYDGATFTLAVNGSAVDLTAAALNELAARIKTIEGV